MIIRITNIMTALCAQMVKRITINQLECLRCQYKWFPRIASEGQVNEPKTCPKCRSPYWDKPVERQSVSDNRTKK